MSDQEKSFAFLHDSVPQWLQDIARVQDKAAAMHSDLTTASMPARRRKTDSTKSIRDDAPHDTAALSHAAQTDPAGTRKRKTMSLQSGRASGPSTYRPRPMVIVNYDGEMQKSFELMVRAIATGRNLLRKAKMEAKMQALAALAGPSDDEDDGDDDDAVLSKISYRPRIASMRTRAEFGRPGRPGAATASVELFETTDKVLEQAQEQCERAAHLALRDGDCRKELQDIRNKLESVLDTAKIQVTKSSEAKLHQVPELVSHDTSDTSINSVEPSYKRHFPHLTSPLSDLSPLSQPKSASLAPLAASAQPRIVDIEVDDDQSDEEEDFVMPPLRLTSRLGA